MSLYSRVRASALCLILTTGLISAEAPAMSRPRVSDSGIRLPKSEIAYKLYVTDGGEVIAASATPGPQGRQLIRMRSSAGEWKTILSKSTSPAPIHGSIKDQQVEALWHSGRTIDPKHPLWVAWKEPRKLKLMSWNGAEWTLHREQIVNNGWFNGFSGKGPDLLWVYGKSWTPDSIGVTTKDFAWHWDGTNWIESEGDLLSGIGGDGMEAMQVYSKDEAYAIQSWNFRKWNGERWAAHATPFEGISGVKNIGESFVVVSSKAGAFGSKISVWDPRTSEPKVLSEHPLYAAGEQESAAAEWLWGSSISDLYLNSLVIREIDGCSTSWYAPGNAKYCIQNEIFRYHWNGSSWSRIETQPNLKNYIDRLVTQWPLPDGSAWIAGERFIDLLRDSNPAVR